MTIIPSYPIYSHDGPQPSLEPERIPLPPDPPKLMSYGNTAQTLSNLIESHFKLSPDFPSDFAVTNNHVFKVILLGERHTNDAHAVANARVIEYLWKTSNNKLLLFTEDGAPTTNPKGQARFIPFNIVVQHWDLVARSEVDEVYRTLYQLNVKSIGDINTILTHIDNVPNALSKFIDLDESIDNLKKNPVVCLSVREYCRNSNVLELSDECENISFRLDGKLKDYNNAVNSYDIKRDKFLHNLIKEQLLVNHEFKICIISGSAHIIPALKFLKRENIIALAMISLEPQTQKLDELNSLKQMFNKIKKDAERMISYGENISNVDNLSLSLLQLKISASTLVYLSDILEIATTEAKAYRG